MKLVAMMLVLLGCLIQVPMHHETYLFCRAGMPNGFSWPTGNDPHMIKLTESYWRQVESHLGMDASLWNDCEASRSAIEAFEKGWTREQAIEEKLIEPNNPIRPLISAEKIKMGEDLKRWDYRNRAIDSRYLSIATITFLVLPWLLVTLGFIVYWIVRRDFVSILMVLIVPATVLVGMTKLIPVIVS